MSVEILDVAEHEERTVELFTEREALQLAIDDRLRHSDLYSASMLSFQHVLVSLELGDRVEAQSCMTMASVFAKADVLIASEALLPDIDVEEPITFTVPFPKIEPDTTRMETDLIYKEEVKARQAIHQTIEAAENELLVEEAYVEPVERNKILNEAVKAICDYIFMNRPGRDNKEDYALLLLANEVAGHLIINDGFTVDTTHTEIAYKVYERLTLAAGKTEGRILPVLRQALCAFKDIHETAGVNSELLKNSKSFIEITRRLRRAYLARNAGGLIDRSRDNMAELPGIPRMMRNLLILQYQALLKSEGDERVMLYNGRILKRGYEDADTKRSVVKTILLVPR